MNRDSIRKLALETARTTPSFRSEQIPTHIRLRGKNAGEYLTGGRKGGVATIAEPRRLDKMKTEMSRSRREIQVAIAMTLALVAGVLIFCATSGLSRNFDFAGCYSAGLIARQSGIAQVYDVPQQAKAQQSIPVGSKLFLIAYPPFQVLLFAQFARFPYAVAYVLWGLMNLALWAAFVIQMRPYASRPPRTPYTI